ncbi:hypothetical protein GR702_10525 [Novosphingobium sp. FGD1]|jgi:hypothetical protein|uniref:Uncharacterized protein n=1 Tax=Novosphingobium silvae TaxID=2692619 RepID=A0A7X4GGJ1_9SPHN|nr:hypothetical protein [Novosphingobium silvae]MYL98202.1 hypothetical protein [Novosphingobium silvae]
MPKGLSGQAARPFKFAFIGVEALFVLVTLVALADILVAENYGLGWTTFFLGFIASAWGAVAYPVCGGCCGWDRRED